MMPRTTMVLVYGLCGRLLLLVLLSVLLLLLLLLLRFLLLDRIIPS